MKSGGGVLWGKPWQDFEGGTLQVKTLSTQDVWWVNWWV